MALNTAYVEIRILLVDDREDNLLSMETVLERDGYSIVKARSGIEALRVLLKDGNFSLILLDVQMPGMNGYETAELIYQREKLRDIPIIFITAQDNNDASMFRGYKTGAVDFIYKPFNPELLISKVAVFAEIYRKNNLLKLQESKLKAINKELETEIKKQKTSEEEIKKLNNQLLTHIEKLKNSNEELERFAYIASHDLQEPLRKIMVYSDMLNERLDLATDAETISFLLQISGSAERMQRLIKEILSFSRITADFKNRKKQNLNEVLNQALANLEVKLAEKKAEVKAGPLPTLQVVPELLSMVFQNLLGNSLKFTCKGKRPKITVSEEGQGTIENGQKYRHISITDNGIGMDIKSASKIFEMFQRLHHQSEFEGSGIGLAICKKIIEQHNGSIRVESKPGKGSKFIISLPEGISG